MVVSSDRPFHALATGLAAALVCGCAPTTYEPPPEFAPKPSLTPEIGLVVLVEGAVDPAELEELSQGFETGVVSSFAVRGYRPIVLSRIARIVAEDDVRGDEMDAREQISFERSTFLPEAQKRSLRAITILHLLVHRVSAPTDSPSVVLNSRTLEGYANYYGWSGNELLFFSEMQSDANWMPIVHSLDTRRSKGSWFSYPPKVWARSLGRRLLRELPPRAPLHPELVDAAGFRVPATQGHVVVPGLRRDFTSALPGNETEFLNYQDAVGNGFSVLVTNGVTWGWEVIPRHADAYLLVDPTCSFKPTELWPTTAEAPVPVPGCVLKAPNPR